MASMSPSPSRSGIGGVVSKARRRRKTGSLASSYSESSELPLPAEKRTSYSEVEDEHEDESSGGKFGKLLSSALTKTRLRKRERERESDERASEEAARGRSVADRGTLGNDAENRATPITAPGDSSSLLTLESEDEVLASSVPPPLSTHPSHIGYLTTSSPWVHSQIIPNKGVDDTQPDGTSTDSATAVKSSPLSTPPKLEASFHESKRRSPSPVGRLKDKFQTHTRQPKSSSPSTSPERRVVSAGTAEARRGSVGSRIGAIFPGKQSTDSTTSLPGRPRTAKTAPPPINTSEGPLTPPRGDFIAPAIVNTPPTPTDFTPSAHQRTPSDSSIARNPNIVTSPSGNMISHRRVRSNSAALGPSKLSNITSAPLTPTLESPGPQSSFFSQMLGAAQSGMKVLGGSIQNTGLAPGEKNKPSLKDSPLIGEAETESNIEEDQAEGPAETAEDKEPAVKTLGMGDLSLSHLGIEEPVTTANTTTTTMFAGAQEQKSQLGHDDSVARKASASTPLLTSESLEGSAADEASDQHQPIVRPRSVYEPAAAGDPTSPNGSVFEGRVGTGVHRSGSIRSKIGSGRRKRGSSAATGSSAIGAAIAAANASLARPAAQDGPKLTGFAVASKKRNRDFHQLFRSVPDDDYLIEDYSCALQREILAHGRMYVSEGHLCFSSNIFGWVTTLVMSFDEIVSVEKRSTAILFKNGLMITTLHAKHVFASFASRDSTYDLIVGIWKLGHPSLRSSLNGVALPETGGGDKTERLEEAGSQSGVSSGEESEDGEEVYDEDDDEDDGMSYTQAGEGSTIGSEAGDKIVSRKVSAGTAPAGGTDKSKEPLVGGASDFPGPASHAPTECSDTHYEKVMYNDTIPAPLGKVYNLVFGPASVSWMSKWLTGECKCYELQMEDKQGLTADNKSRSYSYIKPLGGAIGPSKTKCLITENLDLMDLEKAVTVTATTSTPDVPSGNVFVVKTKYCLTWAEGNCTRMQINCVIEWSGKSWLKGPIEKGASDGQQQYSRDLSAALRAAVSRVRANTAPGAMTGKGAGKGGKRRRKDASSGSSPGKTDGSSDLKAAEVENWGLLEPVRPLLSPIFGPILAIFGPVGSIVKPLLTSNIVYGLLVGLLVASWFSVGPFRNLQPRELGIPGGYVSTAERLAAYEEMWKREETELWGWLEERTGSHRARGDGSFAGQSKSDTRTMDEKVRSDRMSERELEAAIRVTEEKLKLLKDVVGKKTGGTQNENRNENEPAAPANPDKLSANNEKIVPDEL